MFMAWEYITRRKSTGFRKAFLGVFGLLLLLPSLVVAYLLCYYRMLVGQFAIRDVVCWFFVWSSGFCFLVGRCSCGMKRCITKLSLSPEVLAAVLLIH